MVGHDPLSSRPLSDASAGDAPPASAPFKPSPSLSAPRAPSIQGGYSLVPNLLLTTLAAVAVTNVPRAPVLQNQKQTPQVQAFQAPNLLTETLGTQPQAPVGDQQTASAPPPIRIGAAQQTQSRALLDFAVQPIPIGSQQVESAPTVNRVLYWDKGTNTLLFTLPLPVGKGQVDSAPIQTKDVSAEQTQSRALLEQAQQPIPIGEQRTETQVQTPRIQLFTPEQILPPTVVQAELPPGHQSTDSSPPTPRIGEMIYARGVDPGAPAPESNPLPIGRQETDSAPYTIFRPLIDEPQNLLAGPLGLQPVSSSQSEGMPTIRPSQVFLWLPPNVTINLPVAVTEIPIGDQRTENQVTRPAVTVFTPPQIQPPAPQSIPIGWQQTDSAPPRFDKPFVDQPANLLGSAIGLQPVAPGQSNYLGSIWTPPIEFWQAPNTTIRLPVVVPDPLPIGQTHSDSAPIWSVPVGTSVGWTIPPDLLPPGVDIPPESPRVINLAPGWPLRFLVYINGKPHYGTQEEIDELLEEVAEKDAEKPKKTRTRIVVQQGKPIFEKVPAPNKTQLLQFQSNFRDHYLKAYAKYKLEEDDEDDWLLLL